MISLVEYITEANSEPVRELTKASEISEWISDNNAFRIKVSEKDITIKGDKVDILPKDRIVINIDKGVIPFKIGKLNGYLNISWCDFEGDHLADECGGVSFTGVKGCKNLKNITVKISSQYQEPRRSSNGVDFWKSATALSNMRNVTFEFDDASGEFRVERLAKNTLKNIKLVNCDTIRSNSEAKVTVDDLKDVTGVNHIASNSGHIDDHSFDFIDGKWHVRSEVQ